MDDADHRDENPTWFHQKNKYDLNSRIMQTAIISLSIVVILVTLLHIYVRCVLRRQARRRAALQQLGLMATPNMTTSETPKSGIDPSVIALLPIFVFQKTNGQEDMNIVECAVCLSGLEDGEIARLLPNCKHTFHVGCIDRWLSLHSTCPICRTEAEPPRLVPEPREGVAGVLPPAAPPLEHVMEGTSSDSATAAAPQSSAKVSGSSFRLSSFRRILGRERSSQRLQSSEQDVMEDLERQ